MERIQIERNNQGPIQFVGVLVGKARSGGGGFASDPESWQFGTEVKIYLARNGQYVVHVMQWSSRWSDSSNRVGICDTPHEVKLWLRGDARGPLKETSISAILDAAENDAEFEDAAAEFQEETVKPEILS